MKHSAGLSRVHIIAHSMGNWLVASALRERALKGGTERILDQLVLAAPDIPADGFRDRFLKTLPQLARRVTLYVSDNDKALQTSAKFRAGIPRAGLLEGRLMDEKEPRFDVVDATPLPADFLDHSYYATNRSMLADIYCLLHGSPADGRPLIVAAGVNLELQAAFRPQRFEGRRLRWCRGPDAGGGSGATGRSSRTDAIGASRVRPGTALARGFHRATGRRGCCPPPRQTTPASVVRAAPSSRPVPLGSEAGSRPNQTPDP